MKVDIYFPSSTYHENKDTLKKIMSAYYLKWNWARSSWESTSNLVQAEFSGHMQPALLHITGEDRFVELMLYAASKIGAVITYEEITFCLTKIWTESEELPLLSQIITRTQIVQVKPKDYTYRDQLRQRLEYAKERAKLFGYSFDVAKKFTMRDVAATYRIYHDIPLTGILSIFEHKTESIQ